MVFTRLLGYVRHFHPSDQAAATNWEAFAVRGVLTVENAQDAEDLVQRLQLLFRPMAPTIRIFHTGEQPPASDPFAIPQGGPPLSIVYWRHIGFGGGIYQQIGYSSERIRTPFSRREANTNLPDPNKPFYADLGGGVSALVPLALYADEQGTLPHAPPPSSPEVPLPQDARARHLATVALAWNVFQHFYPYFDVVPVDWFAVLKETLAAARTDDESSFLKTLRRMVAQLQDGHGAVGAGLTATAITTTQNPPWDWIENQLVLTLVKPSDPLQPGDVVLKINGQAVPDLIAEEEQYVSASTMQYRRTMAVRYLWAHQTDDLMTLEVRTRSGSVVQVTRSRGEICCTKPARLAPITEIKPDILYLDLTQLSTADFENAVPQMQQASGLIFDVRGYPGKVNVSTLGHLADVPMKWESFYWPIITYPDHQNMDFRVDEPIVDPQKPRLTAKIAFLSDVNALSYAESYLAFAEHYKLGEIVGEPTAGMTGGIDPFTLFDHYTFNWTGTKVLKQDGSRHHGVGILPTVPVSRTIQGIAEGRDEILERAIRVVGP
jgi:C-terminal processing protease CtpA/Prc